MLAARMSGVFKNDANWIYGLRTGISAPSFRLLIDTGLAELETGLARESCSAM